MGQGIATSLAVALTLGAAGCSSATADASDEAGRCLTVDELSASPDSYAGEARDRVWLGVSGRLSDVGLLRAAFLRLQLDRQRPTRPLGDSRTFVEDRAFWLEVRKPHAGRKSATAR